MRTKSFFAAAVCAVAVAGASASAALAGEVIGPPGTPGDFGSGSQIDTQAPAHANSACAFSGLNDFRVLNGPIDFIVQSFGQNVRLYGADPNGTPSPSNQCRGN
jgi:hypothetical protein